MSGAMGTVELLTAPTKVLSGGVPLFDARMWRRLWGAAALVLMGSVCGACQANQSDDGEGPSSSSASGGSGGAGGGGGDVGGTGAGAPACDMWSERGIAPEVFIGPTGVQQLLISQIDAATTSVDLMMYLLSCSPCVDALIAAQNRGVAVRVLLDGKQSDNDAALSALLAAAVPVRSGPDEFTNYHSKLLLIDRQAATVMSSNMNAYSFGSERNYGVVDRDPQDVEQLLAIFERDWAGEGEIDTSCTRLIVSPQNARSRILELISSASQTLDLGVMYVSDAEVKQAIKGKVAQGVVVRVLLAMPEWIDGNAATAQELSAAGAQTKYLYSYELHAKLIVADGVPFVGSENMSFTSLEKNREIGLLVSEAASASLIVQQFEADWTAGSSAP